MNIFRFSDFNSNFDALNQLQRMIDDFFGEHSPFYRNIWLGNRNVFPNVNIFEKGDDELYIKCELPGINKEDIQISIKDKILTISGSRDLSKDKDPSKISFFRKERLEGKFNRTFELPYLVKTDVALAKYEKGILTVKLEKADVAKSKKIAIA